MTRKELYIGSQTDPLYYFENDGIISIDGEIAVSLVGQELCPDALEAVVKYDVLAGETLKEHGGSILKDSAGKVIHGSQNNDIRTLPYSTPIWYYSGGVLIGKFYSTHVERLTKDTYRINAQSVIGVLDDETYYGRYVTDSTVTFSQLMKHIILTNGLSDSYFVEWVQALDAPTTGGINMTDTTQRDRIKFKLKIDSIYSQTSSVTDTSGRAALFGFTAATSNARTSWPKDWDYGIYVEATRTSSTSEWNTYGTAYFVYNGTTFNLGTVNVGDIIEADINPSAGKATINGIEYAITASSDTSSYDFFWSYAGCQRAYSTRSSSWYSLVTNIMIRGKIYYYDVYSYEGTIKRKIRPITQNETYSALVDILNGDIHTRNNDEFGDIVQSEDVFAGCANPTTAQIEMYNSIEYDEGIASLSVYKGYIPVCTKREAIYYLIFSQGVSLIRGTEGGMLFTYLKQATPITISDDDIYKGGSVDYLSDTHKIEVTEHSWYLDSDTTEKTIFDNTEGTALENQIIEYDASEIVDTPTATGISIIKSNGFAAIVTGMGTITAKEYTHNQNIITRTIAANPDGATVSVTDCTMINISNSEAVADRLYEYYSTAEKVSNEIKLTDQFCGRCYSFTNPFDEAKTGYLSKMDLKVSSVLKAACEFICGYAPESPGGNYSHGIVLTGSGTWTVPSEVFEETTPRIRVILISGGQGGSSGLAGEDGEDCSSSWGSASQAKGGAGGTGGAGGRVYSVTIQNPSASYAYASGAGGAGGAACTSTETANTGSNGTDTTFGTYTTADGTTLTNGVTNFFNGEKYGKSSGSGVDGGDGGYVTVSADTITWHNGEYKGYNDASGTLHLYSCGTKGTDVSNSTGVIASGGMGGGAACGSNGSNGGNATDSRAGNGGNGGNATAYPSKPTAYTNKTYRHGWGGIGGYGGGAGGSSGTCAYGVSTGSGGSGGYGGQGGQGADGCILIYY